MEAMLVNIACQSLAVSLDCGRLVSADSARVLSPRVRVGRCKFNFVPSAAHTLTTGRHVILTLMLVINHNDMHTLFRLAVE